MRKSKNSENKRARLILLLLQLVLYFIVSVGAMIVIVLGEMKGSTELLLFWSINICTVFSIVLNVWNYRKDRQEEE